MNKGRLACVALLSFSLLSLSGCGAIPLSDRSVAHTNTQNVTYTKHGKISGKAVNDPETPMSNRHHPFRWGVFSKLYHIDNSPTNIVEPYNNPPDTLPNQTNDLTNTGKHKAVSPPTQTNSPNAVPNAKGNSMGNAPSNTSQKTTNTTVNQMDALANQVIQVVNKARQDNGLVPLKVDPSLIKMANLKAQDMLTQNYFSHTSPTYGSPFDMMKQLDITYTSAGENIAEGQSSAQQVMTDWMNSQGHRANILSPNFTYIGVAHTSNKNIWVQEFIKK